jgi:predicted  nucleic acid-binding Zn-ribbon protein
MDHVLKEILTNIQNLSERLESISSRQAEANYILARLELKIENTTDAKIRALFEYRDIVRGKLDMINNELADIKEHISDHEISLKVIAGQKSENEIQKSGHVIQKSGHGIHKLRV